MSAAGNGSADGSGNGRGRDVIVVDLYGTPENRRVLRGFARAAVSLRVRMSRLRGRRGPIVLVFAPAADGKSMNWPTGADLVFADELLDEQTLRAVNEFVLEAADGLVKGSGEALWPSVRGISLARLNLTAVQEFLLQYAQLRDSVCNLLERTPVESCVILSGYPQVARAIQREVGHLARRISHRALPTFRVHLRRPGSGPEAVDWEPAVHGLAPRVLIVSESRPMAGLFGSVEKALESAGIGPNLRLQYSPKGRGLEPRTGTSVLHLTRPELIAAPQYDFSEGLAAIQSRLKHVLPASAGYQPPLKLLFGTIFQHLLPCQARHLEEMRGIITKTRPELVVVGNDRWWLGMAAVLAAREQGIPTLVIQDGVAWDTPMWTASTADYVAVNGEQLERLLLRNGLPRERIKRIGQPRYDGYDAARAEALRADARALLGITDDRYCVLFATQPNQDASYVRRVAKAILAAPGAQLLLRPHPSTPARARAVLDEMLDWPRVLQAAETDVLQSIAAADLIVVQNSTLALEAALLGKPVITADFTGMPQVVPYAELGIALDARDPEAVTNLVAAGMAGSFPTPTANGSARDGIQFLVGPTDGRSAVRAAELIGELLGHHAIR
jgi:hypothetical protein